MTILCKATHVCMHTRAREHVHTHTQSGLSWTITASFQYWGNTSPKLLHGLFCFHFGDSMFPMLQTTVKILSPDSQGIWGRGSLRPQLGQESDHRDAFWFDRRPGQTAALGAASGGSFPSTTLLWFLVSLGSCSLWSRISSSPRTLSPQRNPTGRQAAG